VSVCGASIFAAACSGTIGDATGNDTPNAAASGSPSTTSGGANAAAASTANAAPISIADYTPLGRLTPEQYNNVVRDLFPGVTVPTQSFPGDIRQQDFFDNNSLVQSISTELTQQYESAAEAIVASLMQSPATILPCTYPPAAADEQACADAFIATTAQRAYRRPLTADETSRLQALYASTRATSGETFESAISLTIQAILQTPQFLFRVEMGAAPADASGVQALTPYEIASRLSFFLWNSIPDAPLFSAAANNALTTDAQIEQQARRMLASPNAQSTVQLFHDQWLDLDRLTGLTKDPTMFPSFNADLVTAMQQETEKFISNIFWNGDGKLDSLLTSNTTFVNGPLAALYGVAAPSGGGWGQVTLDKSERAGLLTQASFLASQGHATYESPVLRGVFVLSKFLCTTLAAPADVIPPLATNDAGAPLTTRQRFAQHASDPACSGCHTVIDGAGFPFEHYDAVGAWRTQEDGQPIDSSGLIDDSQGAVAVTDAIDLVSKLAVDEQVRSCITKQWFRFAFGRSENSTAPDVGTLGVAEQTFASSSYDIRELVIAIAKTTAFRTRQINQPTVSQ
jgi:hypothetical protein